MRFAAALGCILGLALFTALIAVEGFGEISSAVLSAGWGLFWVTAAHLAPMAFSAQAWRSATPVTQPSPLARFMWLRMVREAVDNLLPFAHVGGIIVGARLLIHRRVPPSVAGASVIVDMTMETLSQVVFTVLALGLLLIYHNDSAVVLWTAVGLLLATAFVAAFIVAQHLGLFRVIERGLFWLADRWALPELRDIGGMHDAIQSLYRERRRWVACLLYHLASWVVGAGEVWLAFYVLGHPITVAEALIFEGLAQALRGVAFFVPGGWGVQEGGYMLFAGLYGLPPEIGLAASLLKRFRELAMGLPSLFIWQLSEGERLMNARRAGAFVKVRRD